MASLMPHNLRSRRFQVRRIFMIVVETGLHMVKLKCQTCGHDGGWMKDLTSTESRRQPCPICNQAPHR
jgi:hypothetical protein